jgi:hypothetical protein
MLRAIGAYLALLGVPILVFVYAHAEMANPDLGPDERRAVLLRNLVRSEGTYFGLGMVAGGLWLAIGGWPNRTTSVGRVESSRPDAAPR